MDGATTPGTAGKTKVRFATRVDAGSPMVWIQRNYNGQEVCMRIATHGSVNIIGLESVALEWRAPSTSLQCARQQYEWNRRVSLHEQQHIYDAMMITQGFSQQLNQQLDACARDQRGAEALLAAKIQGLSVQISNAAQTEFDRRSAAFHASQSGGPIPPLDCSVC